MKTRQIPAVGIRPQRGTITRGDTGEVLELRFEQNPQCPVDFRALDAATGEPVVFYRGDVVWIDQLGPRQSVLIADKARRRKVAP